MTSTNANPNVSAPVQLEPMTAADYAAFMASHHQPYVEDRMRADHWTEEEADAFVRKQHAQVLPQDRETAGHHFHNIVARDERVGSLWLQHTLGERAAFVYDIVIEPQYRRRGYASTALAEAARVLKEAGCVTLGLNVFAHNPGAQALYAKLGFAVVSSHMNKLL